MISRCEQMAVPQQSAKPRQIRQFGGHKHAPGWFGCPIGFEQSKKMPTAPKHCAPTVNKRVKLCDQPCMKARHRMSRSASEPRWRNRSTNRGERRLVHLKRVAHVIESDRMRKASMQQRDHMAPRRERSASSLQAMLLGQIRNYVPRNQIAELLQGCIPMSGWLVFLSMFFHTLRVEDLDGTFQSFRLYAIEW